MTSTQRKNEARIAVVEYDARWPSLFERERTLLEPVLRPWLAGPIEHVGSTAVPGLAAKPTIDIMAAVESLEASRTALPVLSRLDYVYFPHRPSLMHWFCKPSPISRTHHLHLVPFRSRLWVERLAFRDYLRRNSATAAEYADLKRRLAKQYEFDREGYTDAKDPFIRRVLQVALPRNEST